MTQISPHFPAPAALNRAAPTAPAPRPDRDRDHDASVRSAPPTRPLDITV